MRNGRAIQRHVDETLLGLVHTLADALRDLAGLAMADADATVAVTHDDDGAEGEAASTTNHLRHAIDLDETLFQFTGVVVVATALRAPISSIPIHISLQNARYRGQLPDRHTGENIR